jgi:lipopolysaccharide transport system ATP-binding protein
VFTSFETDEPEAFDTHDQRIAGRYISRVKIPGNLLNSGRFVVGVNASSYRIKTYFHDEQVLAFNVDASGAPGTHWPEPRLGPVRPALKWEIKKIDHAKQKL